MPAASKPREMGYHGLEDVYSLGCKTLKLDCTTEGLPDNLGERLSGPEQYWMLLVGLDRSPWLDSTASHVQRLLRQISMPSDSVSPSARPRSRWEATSPTPGCEFSVASSEDGPISHPLPKPEVTFCLQTCILPHSSEWGQLHTTRGQT